MEEVEKDRIWLDEIKKNRASFNITFQKNTRTAQVRTTCRRIQKKPQFQR